MIQVIRDILVCMIQAELSGALGNIVTRLDMDMDVLFTVFHVLTIGNYIFGYG